MNRATQHLNVANEAGIPQDPRFLLLAFGPGKVNLVDAPTPEAVRAGALRPKE